MQRQGLGHDFLLQVEAGLKLLARTPEIHPEGYKRTRVHLIKRFPYKITYLISQDSLVILAVLHGKRNPEIAKKRMMDLNDE
ncbi:MAG TPA: type II toxin-antitoxin system RelE/ParE family toxin [Candidatus Lokiarchaeia archaeon]|nr:type II toxin-antitoxin system RelE/ParE family toxin [Candidatus Lokiarchaeia archaeon]